PAQLQRRTARRALRRRYNLTARFIVHFAENLRNNIVGAANEHMSTQRKLQVLPLDIAHIVERTVLYRYACKINGFDSRHWSDFACAAHFPGDRLENRRRLFRLELKRNSPARELVRIAERFTRTHVGQLNHGTVNQEVML